MSDILLYGLAMSDCRSFTPPFTASVFHLVENILLRATILEE
jgi:hypothetical protein